MQTSKNLTNIYGYLPAVFKELKSEWIIEYYAANPRTGKLERQRMRMNQIKKRFRYKQEARAYCLTVCQALNEKLAHGYNPFIANGNRKFYTSIKECLSLYLTAKKKDVRPATYSSYSSFCSIIEEYISSEYGDMFVSDFGTAKARDFLNYAYHVRDVSANTYNNYLKMSRALFAWLQDNGYTERNPFDEMKPKRTTEKKRILVSDDWRERLRDYLTEKREYDMLLACELIFFSLIRPKELTYIKIKHIHNNYITVPAEAAKNHHERKSAVNAEIMSMLKGKLKYCGEQYLFGRNGEPADEKVEDKFFTKKFIRIKKELGMPDNIQLYSLRDSGITAFLKNGVDDLSVMQHADHCDLTMTSRYARHADEHLTDKISKSNVGF